MHLVEANIIFDKRFCDVLTCIIPHSLPGPPSPSNPIRLANVLHNLTGTLSDCMYQSLTGMKKESDALGANQSSQRKDASTSATGNCLDRQLGNTHYSLIQVLRSYDGRKAKSESDHEP